MVHPNLKTVTLSEIRAIYHKTVFLTNSLPSKIDIQNHVQEKVAEVY